MEPPDDDARWEAIKSGIVMFLAFIVFGSIPLIMVTLGDADAAVAKNSFALAVGATGFALFVMGAAKSRFTPRKWYSTGAETLVLGAACAAIAWSTGYAV